MAVWNPRANELFLNALELTSPTERQAHLENACGEDAPLRQAVEALLKAHQAAGSLLEPLIDASGGVKTLVQSPPEGAGAIIGNYKLLQLIGEGGFGSVFMAEQERPVRRRVALKIIKLGMDTKQVIARFEAERQALAMMDHPNIAKILDAGATASGRPYFVMELVKGISITKYCDTHKLSTEARLHLFVAVCNALQHAHQKGIIHRDIKPGNVLVTLHDGTPVPKLIDFGIAKATQLRLTEKTLFTEFRQLIGTPAYMSPEQAEMSGLDVDTRSDIYSLGVLLYELLTGTTPFDPKDLYSAAYAEMRRIIREVDPPKPSTRLSTLGEPLAAIATNRDTDGRKLSQLVRGELDWIVMKALEKDRTRRYESAGELARDVGRHLDDQPVEACPPRTIYRLKKFVRRNRAIVLTAAAAVAVAVTAGAIYIHGIRVEQHKTELALSDARAQRAEAEKQKKSADQRRDEARKQERIAASVNEFLSNMLSSADPQKLLGDKVTVVQAIEAAVKQLDAGADTMDPLKEASVRDTIGMTLMGLARYDEAEPNLRKALAICRRALPAGHAAIAVALNSVGLVLVARNKPEEAEPLYREELEIDRKALPAGHPAIARCLNNLANLLTERNKLAEAEPMYREALRIYRKALPAGHPDIALSLHNLAMLLTRQNKPDEAEALYREALEIRRKALPAGHPEIAKNLNNLAILLKHQNKFEEAEKLYREALEIDRKALPAGHPDIALKLNNLANLLESQNKPEEAEPMYREALDIVRKALPAGHPDIARSLGDLAVLLARQNKLEEAEPMCREALEIRRKSLPAGHPDIAASLRCLGLVLKLRNKPEEAEKADREALEIDRKTLPAGHPDIAESLTQLATVLRSRNRLAEAEPMCREALEINRKALPTDQLAIANRLLSLANVLEDQNKPKEAEPMYREALDIDRRALPAGHPYIATCLNDLGLLLEKQHKAEEAEKLYREALGIRRKALPAGHPFIATSLNNLALLLVKQNKLPEAEPMYREALEIRRKALPAGHPDTAASLRQLGGLLAKQKNTKEAEKLCREALEIDRKALPAGHPDIAMCLEELGYVLFRAGGADLKQPDGPARAKDRWAEAETLFRESLDIRRKALPAGDSKTVATADRLAFLLMVAHRAAEAEPLLREMLKTCRQVASPDSLEIATLSDDLGTVLDIQHKTVEAEPLFREALAARQRKLGTRNEKTRLTAIRLANLLDKTGRASEARTLRGAYGIAAPTTRPVHTQPTSRGAATKP